MPVSRPASKPASHPATSHSGEATGREVLGKEPVEGEPGALWRRRQPSEGGDGHPEGTREGRGMRQACGGECESRQKAARGTRAWGLVQWTRYWVVTVRRSMEGAWVNAEVHHWRNCTREEE